MSANNSNLPEHDAAWWANYRARIERAARTAAPDTEYEEGATRR
jgi:hypothetical protein